MEDDAILMQLRGWESANKFDRLHILEPNYRKSDMQMYVFVFIALATPLFVMLLVAISFDLKNLLPTADNSLSPLIVISMLYLIYRLYGFVTDKIDLQKAYNGLYLSSTHFIQVIAFADR